MNFLTLAPHGGNGAGAGAGARPLVGQTTLPTDHQLAQRIIGHVGGQLIVWTPDEIDLFPGGC